MHFDSMCHHCFPQPSSGYHLSSLCNPMTKHNLHSFRYLIVPLTVHLLDLFSPLQSLDVDPFLLHLCLYIVYFVCAVVWTDENHQIVSGSLVSRLRFDPGTPKYETRVLTTWLWCSVCHYCFPVLHSDLPPPLRELNLIILLQIFKFYKMHYISRSYKTACT
jgi:hypothetical protein